jgi:hypothetical protein
MDGMVRPTFEPLEERRLLAAVLHVDQDARGLHDGSSWANAYTDLQDALRAAAAGDQVWVAAGTYRPTATANRSISLNLKSGVAIYGGFAGSETSLAQRNWTTNVTTLSGDLGVAGDMADNSYHVVYASGVTDSRLDGFTITAGNASAGFGHTSGGGMLCVAASSPTIANCVFTANAANYGGGGLANHESSPTIVNCVFRQNTVALTGNGGGLYNYSGSPTLTNVAFKGNTAVEGGAVYNCGKADVSSSPVLRNVTLAGNSAARAGGAIASTTSSHPTLINAILWGNSASSSPEIYDGSDSSTAVSYSIVAGGHSGTGNLQADPLLVDAAGGDLHLTDASPAIDTGTSRDAPTTDLDGRMRPQDGNYDGVAGFDMGAYEYPCSFNDTLLTKADVGAGKFVVTVGYGAPMDTSTNPTISFSKDVSTTLTFAAGSWTDCKHYTAQYDVANANVAIAGVTATVTGARDARGIVLPSRTLEGAFAIDIDTNCPTVGTVSVKSGVDYFEVTLTYREAMDRSVDPTLKVFPHPSTAYTVAHANWISDRQFQARYQADDKIFSLGVVAFGAKDVAGNVQTIYSGTTTITGTTIGSQVGLFDPVESVFSLNTDDSGDATTRTIALGTANAGWTAIVGDWDGDGGSDLGVYDPVDSKFYLANGSTGKVEYAFGFGNPGAGWIPLVGDWDGDGLSSVGLYDPASSTFYLTDTLVSGVAQHAFGFGNPGGGWTPLVGDWDGDGISGVGLYNPHSSTFYLTDAFVSGFARYTFGFGVANAGWQPLVGDWNGDTMVSVGLYDPHCSTFYLADALTTGYAQHTFGYGEAGGGWIPLVGDWNGNGAAGVGLFDPAGSTFYLTNNLTGGFAEVTFHFGRCGAGWQPVIGTWPAADEEVLDAVAVDLVASASDLAKTDSERLTDLVLQRL